MDAPLNDFAAHVPHLERLYAQSPLLVALFDVSDTMRYANPAFVEAFGIAPGLVPTWSGLMQSSYLSGVGAAIHTDDFDAWLSSTRSRRGKQPFRAFEADLSDGRWIYMTETVDLQGWMLCIAFDISAMRVGERTLRLARDGALRAAQTDVLTGISNRAHVMQQLDKRLEQLHRQQQPCGLVLLDLDHFKRVNDTYGHQAGDVVLVNFARLVESALRREDGFGRIGGEEFLLLCPNVDRAGLEHMVTRVLNKVRVARPLADEPAFGYTCSAGLAMLDPVQDTTQNLRRADAALYVAKADGRDRMVWAED